MNTRKEVLQYAQQVHQNLTGEPLPKEMSHISDHPYDGYSLDTIKNMVNGDLVKVQVRAFEKELKKEVDQMFASLAINTPVKVMKGSKDKKGIEGFILFGKEPLQGSGQALFVYDVLTHRNCMVRSSAVKVRLPKPGERDVLHDTYYQCKTLTHLYSATTKVSLKDDPSKRGIVSADPHLNPNLDGHGFHQVPVVWEDGETSTHILTELQSAQ